VTRLSKSLELGAKMKVRPLITVSTRPVGATAGALLALYMLGTARCCRKIKVKLNVSSSSLGKRIRNGGGPSFGAAASGSCKQCLAWAATRGALKPHLNVVDDTLVAKLAPCAVSRRRERIWADVQQRAVAAVGDVDRGDRNCARLAVHSAAHSTGLNSYIASGRADTGRRARRLCC
jgi:hypothetical protein